MNWIKIIGFLAIAGLTAMAGCRAYNKVYSDYDRTADFSRYKTFAWLPDRDTANTTSNNQIIRNNTLNYFTHCMGERALQAELDSPDVLLQLVVRSLPKQLTMTSAVYSGSPGGGRYNPYYYPHPNNYYYHSPFFYGNTRYVTERYDYAESTITLNVYDRRQSRLVWTGTAQGDLFDPAYMADNLHPAVYRILKKFPIKPLQREKARNHTATVQKQH
ncbi:MAG TPA: DUF4136 domain-containing protein [Saprospiraceae bacterium]|nr:DUF4136 domain-containing protein [Saprospiraceae bacterium]